MPHPSDTTAVTPANVTLADVRRAADVIRDSVMVTACNESRTLGEICGCRLFLKFENLQFTSTFKERGALNRLQALSPEERKRGVIAMSAGNHAQGVAYHAKRLGIPATIVMPIGTPMVKIENTRRHGAEVIITGQTLEECFAFVSAHAAERGLILIHPYDDPLIIAGQGTIGLEMLAAVPELDILVVPIGGGGLISGIATAAKAIKPSVQIVGVQAQLYPSMYNAVKGEQLPMRGDTLAEGIAVKAPGQITTRIVRDLVDDIVLVSEDQIERAVATLISIEKTVVEGAGAAGLAAVLAAPGRFAGRNVGLVLTGGNIDTRLIASVLTRELAREGRLTQLALDIVDRPGQLAAVSILLADAGANIIEVSHQRTFSDLPAKATLLELVIETRDRAHLEEVLARLGAEGFAVRES
ncbi:MULTISPECIES: threonine ammonia-lyase [unclassified Bradyrhizobium]|uniref:threonine ammonia-lyase n=1 Tax=unclassified Bradyrhizobium TaxID=2631580 RepID=UPI001BA57853|nr:MULTISPECIES: threonine ammonia-lyase [unclassified Bradyrhizobium]MBR1205201.1 threonine ammonia-lyase [Bradyrhizobium sp. AUGA SZCCT0124]MBR1312280.1 threonine ammonia-lyase [Bradyrhizobium sp. AUGA SZCCT0051]MBR1342171.1 threonine ammonia-lyase [Bradyrhizobium sp. AUGA SZCCT0105]MBR1358962.1 threonine ammonia-lyase [Bradyrhizobium sp. AUGA SZCCT0045]